MKKIYAALLFSLALLAGGCLTTERPDMTWHLTLSDATTKEKLAGYAVTLVLRSYDSKEERFGPVVTDSKGFCVVKVPAQKRQLSSYSKDAFKMWLEVHLGDRFEGVAEQVASSGTSGVFELRREEKPNKSPEPTPRLGVARSLFRRAKPSGNLRGVAHL
jgi:hypothetical protein